MRKIILYSASSLDQFIARKNGEVDWLFSDPNCDYGFFDFFDSIDVTLMGNKTYQQVLSFDVEFPYKGKDNYVFTRNSDLKKDENVQFITSEIDAFINNLKSQKGKDIWLVGGGEINSLFLKNGWIDEICLSVHPVWLGEGLPLFPQFFEQRALTLEKTKAYETGLVQLVYSVNKKA